MVDLFHMQPCIVPHSDFCTSYQYHNHQNDTHIHHHPLNGDKVEIQHDPNGGHTEIVHHADGTTESYRYNANDTLMAVQGKDGHWCGLGLIVPDRNHDTNNSHVQIAPETRGVIW